MTLRMGAVTAWTVSGSVSKSDWQGSSTSWVKRSVTLNVGPSGPTIPAGYWIEVVIIVDNSSNDDMWFAYDTAAYPTKVTWP